MLSKEDKAKLAKGAEKIRKLEKAAKKPAKKVVIKFDFKESKRSPEEVWKQRVEVLPNSIGVKIDKDTPLNESLLILDYGVRLEQHAGFIVGDILNFGQQRYGEKYQKALNITGRAYSTLAGYAETSRKIPVSDRLKALSFSHHREMLRASPKLLADVKSEIKKGNIPTVRELRARIGKRKSKKSAPVAKITKHEIYTPTEEEKALMGLTEKQLGEVSIDKLEFIAKTDVSTMMHWSKVLAPYANLCNRIDKALVPF